MTDQRTDTRSRLLESTVELLRTKGASATGTAEILRVSRAPRGSFYFHFPGGKEQLVDEALGLYAGQTTEAIRAALADSATPLPERVGAFVLAVGRQLQDSSYGQGCAVGAVTVEAASTSETLRQSAQAAFTAWIDAFAEFLRAEGVSPAGARALATTIVAALEGALILGRAYRVTAPLEAVAEQLTTLVAAAR